MSVDTLDKSVIINNILSKLPIECIVLNVSSVSKFFRLCSTDATMWSQIQDEDYILEFEPSSRNYEAGVKFTKELMRVREAWEKVAPIFSTIEMPQKQYSNTELHQWFINFLKKYKKSLVKRFKLPLDFRLHLRERAHLGRLGMNGEENLCDISSAEQITSFMEEDLDNGLWVPVAGTHDDNAVTICCDTKDADYGGVYKYNSYRGFRGGVNANSWVEWFSALPVKKKRYEAGNFHNSDVSESEGEDDKDEDEKDEDEDEDEDEKDKDKDNKDENKDENKDNKDKDNDGSADAEVEPKTKRIKSE